MVWMPGMLGMPWILCNTMVWMGMDAMDVSDSEDAWGA